MSYFGNPVPIMDDFCYSAGPVVMPYGLWYTFGKVISNHLKKRILVQYKGGPEFQPAGILQYVEELKREPTAAIGPKDIFK